MDPDYAEEMVQVRREFEADALELPEFDDDAELNEAQW